MKIYALRIGDKYGPEYETYVKNKLKDYDLTIVNEPFELLSSSPSAHVE